VNTDDPQTRASLAGFADAAGLAFDGIPPCGHADFHPDECDPPDGLMPWAVDIGEEVKRDATAAMNVFAEVRDPAILGQLLVSLKGKPGKPGAIQVLQEFAAMVEGWFIEATGNEWEVEIPGLARFIRHKGGKRKDWADDRLVEDVLAWSRSNPAANGDGEVVPPDERLLLTLRKVARFDWRTGRGQRPTEGLKSIGLAPDLYCRTYPGPDTIEIA
jgi:hypothetical protein